MERKPNEDLDRLMAAFDSKNPKAAEKAQAEADRIQDEIRKEQEAAKEQKQPPPTIIEGEVE